MNLALWRVLGIDEFGTVACAWHRQVRRADARRSQAHAAKRQQEQHGKPNRKRGGAEPSPLTRFGDRPPLFPPRTAFFHWFLRFITPLEFALFRSAMAA